MKNRICTILCLLTMMGFVLVFVQERWHPFRLKPLAGVTFKTERPELTLKDFVSGTYQSDAEQYSRENFGFREAAIRGYNQFLWSLFHETNCHFIVPGKDGWLFYKEAFNDYYGIEPIHFYKTYDRAREWARKDVRMMNKLRYLLKDYDIEFLCFMAPNKAEIYPEYLPYHTPAPADAINTAMTSTIVIKIFFISQINSPQSYEKSMNIL